MDEQGKLLLVMTFHIQVDPWSRQSSKQDRAITEAVKEQLRDRGFSGPWMNSPICLTIVSLVPRNKRVADVDNLVKGLLDSMEGVLYKNDKQVQCLTTRRIEYGGTVGMYTVRAAAVHPWQADVIYDNPADPIVLTGKRIVI
ncbi:hypothetical protein B1L11_00610 [Microbispora sp. GKU 823]|nr:hypothetical protein B1L11_00610 [Microbispora sp. GKU 823]